MQETKVNIPLQNNRYRGPIESVKLENSILILSQAIRGIELKTNGLQTELERMRSHSNALYFKIYEGAANSCL